MTVFKTFLKILNKNKIMIIIYTSLLVLFSVTNMSSNESSMSFSAEKPRVLIVNNDTDNKITNNLIKYIKANTKEIKVDNREDARDDALFYEDVNYIIYIPKNYGEDYFNHKNPVIDIKKKDSYNSELAEMILERYLKVSNIYLSSINDEDMLIDKINETLSKDTKANIKSKLDTNISSKATFYFNFASYAVIASLVYIICLILFSFNEQKIKKRTIISSMNYKKHNKYLLLSNMLLALFIWLFYVIISFIIVGNIMFKIQGLIYIINLLLFTVVSTTMAILLSNILKSKNAISGIINVIALGSSFLCGVFVPLNYLPKIVVSIAHLLPTYYYVNTNEIVSTLDIINIDTLKPIIINMIILVIFSILFIIITNIISKRKRKIG